MIVVFRSVLLALVLVGCSQLPAQKRDLTGGIYDQGPVDFAVFAEDSSVLAVRLGDVEPGDKAEALAVRAIERATGCKVVAGTMTGDEKTLEAAIHCVRPENVARTFVRLPTH